MKQLDHENWLQPDPTVVLFVRRSPDDGSIRQLSGEDWASAILAVQLSDGVPTEVRKLFEVARGALVYGYFYYPLYTLGTEQLFRVADSAVMHKCLDIGVSSARLKKLKFHERLKRLIDKGIIPLSDERRWEALWQLRNISSHPNDQSILPPTVAIDELRRIANDIDGIFCR